MKRIVLFIIYFCFSLNLLAQNLKQDETAVKN